jgi:hypothetical protein
MPDKSAGRKRAVNVTFTRAFTCIARNDAVGLAQAYEV